MTVMTNPAPQALSNGLKNPFGTIFTGGNIRLKSGKTGEGTLRGERVRLTGRRCPDVSEDYYVK